MDESTQERILELLDEDKTANEIVKILKDEDNIKISKATVNRTRQLTKVLGDDKKLTPEERDVYLSYMKKSVEKKEKKHKIWHTIFHPITRTAADGPFDPNMPEISQDGHQSFLNNYIPRNAMEAVDVDVDTDGKILSTPTPFTARRLDNTQVLPKFFWNPYTALDLIVFQDIYTHTICGTIIDVVVAFVVGMGIKPVLKLVNEHDLELQNREIPDKEAEKQQQQQQQQNQNPENPEQNQQNNNTQEKPKTKIVKETKDEAIEREINDNENLLEPLIQLDRWIGENNDDDDLDDGIKEDWNTKVEAIVRNHYIFGRDMMTREVDPTNLFEWNNKKWKDIETIYKVQHPRDINFIEISQKTFNIKRVSLMFSANMLDKDDMIYLAHMEESPIYNGKGYGYALEQRMLGHGRSLRKLIDRDFPNVASIGYAPFTIVATKRDEKGTTNEASQGQTFINTLVSGQPNHTALKDPKNDLVVHHIDTKPDIPGMIDMAHYHAEAAAKVAQVPTALIAKEKDPNRDCYSEDTMTLTESGWKYYNEIDWRNERIATFNPDNGNIEYHYPDKMSVYPYEGDMIHIKTKNQDVMVTPDHDMWVSSKAKKIFKKVKAEKLLEKKEFVFKEFGNWVGNSVPEMYPLQTVSLQASGNNLQALQMSTVKIDTWLKFMGYYISEGTKSYPEKYGSDYFVSIAQHEESDCFNEMKQCMDEIPFNYYDNVDKEKCHRFRFSNKQLVANLKDTGILHNTKQIPKWMLNLTPDKLEILFKALMQGDGTTNKKSGTKSYYTTSIQLARDVQELAMKIGYNTNIKTCHEAKGNRVKLYRVFISKNKRNHFRHIRNVDVKRVPYKGIVYCFGVQNHLFVTSRNGTVTVQGNTMLGILRVFAETEIPRKRMPIIKVFTNQYYMRNFKKFYKGKPEVLKKFRVEAEFTDVKIDSWADIVGAFVELNKIFRFKAEAAGKILNIDNLEGKIDPEKEPLGESTMDLGNGNKLSMSGPPKPPKKST